MPTITQPLQSAPQPKTLTGRHVLFMMLAFFGVIITVNAVMMTLAIETLPGTVTDSSYQASQRHNRELAAGRAREAQGWKVDAIVERSAAGTAAVRIALRDSAEVAVPGLTVTAVLRRPLERYGDRSFVLDSSQAGIFTGTTEGVAAGGYDLAIEAKRDGQVVYRSKNRVLLP